MGFSGGPCGLAVVARNRVLVGKLGRIEKRQRALFQAGHGERGGDTPVYTKADWIVIFDERGGPDAEPDDDGRTMRSLLDDDFIDVLSLFFY